MNMTRINYAVCLCISLHGLESICGFSRSFFSKNESLSRLGTLQAITYVGLHEYTVKVDSIEGMARDRHIVTTHHQ